MPFQELADATKRSEWVRERGLTVFSLYSDAHPATEVDLFVQPPLDFDAAHQTGARIEIAPGIRAMFVSYDDLLHLKAEAGRPQDLEDIRQLEALRRDESGVSSHNQESGWERGWQGHERAQRRRLARLPFPEKLKWLEEAHNLVRSMQSRAANRDRAPSKIENGPGH